MHGAQSDVTSKHKPERPLSAQEDELARKVIAKGLRGSAPGTKRPVTRTPYGSYNAMNESRAQAGCISQAYEHTADTRCAYLQRLAWQLLSAGSLRSDNAVRQLV